MSIASRISVWADGESPTPPVPPAYWGLYFEAEAANVVVNMAKSGSPSAVTLETSTDGNTWTAFDSEGGTTPITLANIGDRVYFRAGAGGNATFASSSSTGHTFTLSGAAGAHGNIMSILDGANEDNLTIPSNFCFAALFRGCSNLASAPMLPALTVLAGSYAQMFMGCTSLTAAPDLPATSIKYDCYSFMFSGCTSLVTSPTILPATTLGNTCYNGMFLGCSSLTTAPALPATTLKSGCYAYMFDGCAAIQSAPVLSASTLLQSSYQGMFRGCSSLTTCPPIAATTLANTALEEMFGGCSNITTIEVAFSAWNPTSATNNWLSGVAATGTFKCPAALGDDSTITRGTSNCPSGWTVVNV